MGRLVRVWREGAPVHPSILAQYRVLIKALALDQCGGVIPAARADNRFAKISAIARGRGIP